MKKSLARRLSEQHGENREGMLSERLKEEHAQKLNAVKLQRVITDLGKMLQSNQSYQFHLLARQEKIGRDRKECSYTNGKIDAYRTALQYLGLHSDEIAEIQWGFTDNADKQ